MAVLRSLGPAKFYPGSFTGTGGGPLSSGPAPDVADPTGTGGSDTPMPGLAPTPTDTGVGRPTSTIAESTESPGERSVLGTGGMPPGASSAPGGITSTPRAPSVPTPMAGAASPAMDSSAGVIPFTPMTGPDPVSTITAQSPTLYGSQGGLTGGGLGIPQDPTSRANNNSIEGLIQLLQQQLGR